MSNEEMQEQQDDQEKNFSNLRRKLEERDEALKARDAELEQLRAEREQIKAEKVANIFRGLGLSEKQASLYKGEPDESAITEWATEYGFVSRTPSSESVQDVDTYNRLVAMGAADVTTSDEKELQEVLAGNLRLIEKGMRTKGGLSAYKPTPEDIAESEALDKRVNSLIRRHIQDVRAGRADPDWKGFGGPMDPPPYARTYERGAI